MNWKVVLTLAVAGVVMGFVSLTGFTEGIEFYLWIAIAVFCGWWIARHVSAKPFLHGLLVGLLDGILNSIIQVSFFSTYLANNERGAKGFSDIPGGVPPEIFLLLFGPIIGIAYGAFVGLCSVLASKLLHRKAPQMNERVV